MNQHILIAEDEDDMRHLISKIKASIDLVLLDIMMPKLSGLEVCKRIRQQVDCPIVFISAASDEMNRIKALSLGGDDFISKPFSLEELTLKIEAMFNMKDR